MKVPPAPAQSEMMGENELGGEEFNGEETFDLKTQLIVLKTFWKKT